jgi:Fe-S cluster assembly iron-binding protein IscA
MLTITDEAAGLISALGREVNAAAGSGLRITIDAHHDSLSMALAPGAAPGDTVVHTGETQVFLSPAAADRVSTYTLHAKRSAERSSFFLK